MKYLGGNMKSENYGSTSDYAIKPAICLSAGMYV